MTNDRPLRPLRSVPAGRSRIGTPRPLFRQPYRGHPAVSGARRVSKLRRGPALITLLPSRPGVTRANDQAAICAAILKALQPVARREDVDLLIQACETYEYWPPILGDAVLIRSAGLLRWPTWTTGGALSGGAHSRRPLVARDGEPAVTAALGCLATHCRALRLSECPG